MSVEEQIANLRRIGALKSADRDEKLIQQYLSNAEEFRTDAAKAASALSRFILGYEALHALSMAFLTHHGVRTSGEGHRSTALQLSIGELAQIDKAAEAIIRIHTLRNDSTYFKPIPPVSEAIANATLKLLDAALKGATAKIAVSGQNPPKPPG